MQRVTRKTLTRLTVGAVSAAMAGVGLMACGGSDQPPGAAAPTVTASTRPASPANPTGQPAASLPGPSGAGGIALGVYVKPTQPIGGQTASLAQFDASIGRRLAIVQTFTGWQTATGGAVPFPTAFATYANSIGATPMITWQPEQAIKASGAPQGLLSDQPNFSLVQLASGRYDAYIRSWAEQAKAFGRVVYVRPMQEMNDRIYPWSVGVNGNSGPAEFITAWRHIVGIFQDEGASNVQFVWCVGANPTSPNPAEFFPGDSYTSWIALDGYNRGAPWQSFTSIFSAAYGDITAVSDQPVMVAEIGSVESSTDPSAKASWIASTFDQEIPQGFPRIRAVVYFDAPGRGFSYSLASSPAALSAFSAVAGSPEYQGYAPT
jgi:hypothetical protein